MKSSMKLKRKVVALLAASLATMGVALGWVVSAPLAQAYNCIGMSDTTSSGHAKAQVSGTGCYASVEVMRIVNGKPTYKSGYGTTKGPLITVDLWFTDGMMGYQKASTGSL